MRSAQTQPVVALYGPTSSGKTALSLDLAPLLARRLRAEPVVISADSRQVYRHMDVGTSKTLPGERRAIRHEMIDVADPSRKLELEHYLSAARAHISTTLQAGRIPLVVGGTGTYVKGLVEGWDATGSAAATAALRRDFPPALVRDAHATLRRVDSGAASRVHANNYEAVINALAAAMTGTRTRRRDEPAARVVLLGLDPGPGAVDRSVERTLEDQLRRGLHEEVVSLAARYRLEERRDAGGNQVLRTHGYREFFDVARAHGKRVAQLREPERQDVRRLVVEHVRAYTRRQRSWFRKLGDVRMVRSSEDALRAVVEA